MISGGRPFAAPLAAALLALAPIHAGRVRPPPSARPPAVSIVFSGQQDGYLTPCGCSEPMLGGLPRLATYLHGLGPQQPIVKLFDGDLTPALGRQDEMKAETMVAMMDAMGYQALGVGETDLRLGLPFLASLKERFHGAFVCANVRRPDGSPAFQEYAAISTGPPGHQACVLVTSVLSMQFAASVEAVEPDARVQPPAQALSRLAPVLAKPDALRVLLYHGPADEARALIRRFPWFQLVVVAHEGDSPSDATAAGSSLLACAGQDGKYVGRAVLRPGSPARSSNITYTALSPAFKNDPALERLKSAYLGRVAAEHLLEQVIRAPTLDGDAYAGSAACQSCHAAAYRVWKSSLHARALDTLAAVNEDADPECVICHTVGLDRQTGFVSRQATPNLVGVGCESCHGPAARHVKDPHSAPLPHLGPACCDQCHTAQQSPHFAFDTYWPRIEHH